VSLNAGNLLQKFEEIFVVSRQKRLNGPQTFSGLYCEETDAATYLARLKIAPSTIASNLFENKFMVRKMNYFFSFQ